MLEVSFNFDDIEITNILHEDLSAIIKRSESDTHFSIARLNERFLESYLSECEYFLKISRRGELIGLVKGRVEFKKPHEAWIWFYYMDSGEDCGMLDRAVAEKLLEYLNEEYCVRDFYIRVPVEEHKAIEFWRGMGFKLQREVKDFYFIDGQNVDMLILENKNMKFRAKKNIL
jgi:ribosomal protein S18 acetylase RimI-like enzyme